MKLGPLILISVVPRRLGVDQHLGIENQKWKVTIIFAIYLQIYEHTSQHSDFVGDEVEFSCHP